MSDDDNYSWLDKYSSFDDAPAEDPSTLPPSQSASTPGTSAAAPPPVNPSSVAGPGASSVPPPPPVSNNMYTGRDEDPLAKRLAATQPRSASRRFSRGKLVAIVGVVAALVAIANFTSFGGENIRSLDAGTCIELPDSLSNVKYVEVVSCGLAHDGEVIADANGTRQKSEDLCTAAFNALDPAKVNQLPFDTQVATFGGAILKSCVVYSPSGALVGSLLD